MTKKSKQHPNMERVEMNDDPTENMKERRRLRQFRLHEFVKRILTRRPGHGHRNQE